MNRFDDIISRQKYDTVMKNINTTIRRNSVKFQERLPFQKTKNGIYHYDTDFYDSFHGGFWTGIYYHGYNLFNDIVFKCYAENMTNKLYSLIKIRRIYHKEMGLLYIPVCMEDIKLNHSNEAAEIAVLAADYMIEGIDSARVYYISMLTNVLILHFAYRLTNNTKYKDVAEMIEKMIFKHHISFGNKYDVSGKAIPSGKLIDVRDDTLNYGYPRDCGYIRPYAWAIHGLACLYSLSGDSDYETILYDVINYYLTRSDGDLTCFMYNKEASGGLTDTTSTSIILCALFELLKVLSPSHYHYRFYYKLLKKNFNILVDNHLMHSSNGDQGLLNGGIMLLGTIGDRSSKLSNNATICGDYFFMEALMHLNPDFYSCWDINNIFKNNKGGLYQNEITK